MTVTVVECIIISVLETVDTVRVTVCLRLNLK